MKKILFYITLIIIWELVYRLGVDVLKIWKPYSFPSPLNTVSALVRIVKDGSLFTGIFYSVRRLIVGYAISVITGLFLGFIIYRFKVFGEKLKPLILGLQSLPSICWVPFALLWFGIGEKAIIFIIVLGSTFSIAISISEAIANVSPLYIKAAKTMGIKHNGIGSKSLFRKVILPGGLPTILLGLKQGWAFAWRALISGEVIASRTGLGYILMVGRDFQDIGQVAGIMVVIIIIGLALDKLLFNRINKEIIYKWGLE